jgi:hypothetical protein
MRPPDITFGFGNGTEVLFPQPTPPRQARILSLMSSRVLSGAVDYLYSTQPDSQSSEERDALTLALRILGACRRGEPQPYLSASYSAFGSSFEAHRKRREAAQSLRETEYLRCIPDYDPASDPRLK